MPYSDNMYSSLDASDDEPMADDPLRAHRAAGAAASDAGLDEREALAPSDGYFGGSGVPSSSPTQPLQSADAWRASDLTTTTHAPTAGAGAASYAGAASSQVPHVPDVWVSDPSLEQGSTAENKAREAREEREAHEAAGRNRHLNGPPPSTALSAAALPPAAAASSGRGSFSGSAYPLGHARTSSAATSSHTPYQPYHHSHTPSSTSYPSRSRRSDTLYSERSSLFSTPNEAPPAYTPSPFAPFTPSLISSATTIPTSPVPPRGYSTFTMPEAIMGRQEETQGLLAHQPESMGGPSESSGYGDLPSWRERVRRRLPPASMKSCRTVLLVLLLLGVTVGFLVSSIVSLRNEKHKEHVAPPGTPGTPGDNPPSGSKPDYGKAPVHYPPMDDGDFEWESGHHCAFAKIKSPLIKWDVDFSRGRSLTIIQDIGDKKHPSAAHDLRVSGEVIFRRAAAGSPGPSLVLESMVNVKQLAMDVIWDSDEQQLHITTPRSIPWSETQRWPCVYIRATVWVPDGGVLNSINVDNVHLDIRLLDDLSVDLGGPARFHSVVGNIAAATDGQSQSDGQTHDGAPASFRLNARHVEVKTTSGNISGSWPLYDFLGLETVSGTVKADVEPKAASREPAPASLYVRSLSGDVEVWEPVREAQQAFSLQQRQQQQEQQGAGGAARAAAAEAIVPPRDYRADISSTSGRLRGALAIGSETRVHTTSGNMDLELLPVFDRALADGTSSVPKTYMELETTTVSGTTLVRVLEPLWVDVKTGSYQPIGGAPEAPRAPEAPAPPALGDYGDAGARDPYTIPWPAGETADDDDGNDEAEAGSAAAAPALRCLEAKHHTTSSHVALRYPGSWEGDVDAATTSGGVSLRGDGLRVKKGGSWARYGTKLSGHKGPGEGGSHVTVKTVSGGIDFLVGEA